MLGRRIGSWILERELGRGGMGAVFQACHATLHTHAAVKVLSAGLEPAESFRQRFRREAELQAQLRHHNVARVLDYLEDGGQWFLVIEFLDRGSLADWLSRGGRVSQEQAVVWMRQALAGLGHAHEKGIVHRDVKPANLMFSASGDIVVVDFGIARAETAAGLTGTGITIGTPHYMSPEQIVTPQRVDGRADIYSLGVILYELLAGRRPFEADSEFSVLQAHVTEPPPPLRTIAPEVPAQLEAVVMRALAKSPDDRYPDCASMIRALAAPEAVVPPGATVHRSVLYERAPMPDRVAPSAGDLRARNRRAFRRRLAAGTIAVLLIAMFLAIRQSDSNAETIVVAPPVPVTKTTVSQQTTTVSVRALEKQRPAQPRAVQRPTDHEGQTLNPRPPSNQVRPSPNSVAPPLAVAPVPPAQTLPENPQIAVIGMGSDPMLAGALEQEMERRLAGYHLADERGVPEVDEILGRKDVTPKAIGPELLAGGFHILVVLRVEAGEQREFELRGQSIHAKTARVRLNAYLLPVNRSIGSGWTELVEYTELSASAKAKQAFIGATADLRQAIDGDWARARAAAGGMQ